MRFNEGPVKYFDFKGEAAVDISYNHSLLSELKRLDLANADELLAGFRLIFNENSQADLPQMGLLVYLYDEKDLKENNNLKKVRAVDVDMKTSEIFGFFKRCDILMTKPDFITDNTEIDGPHYD